MEEIKDEEWLFRLPELQHVKESDLNDWVTDPEVRPQLAKLNPGPEKLLVLNKEKRMQHIRKILEETEDGRIDLVLERLCEECHCKYDDIIQLLENEG